MTACKRGCRSGIQGSKTKITMKRVVVVGIPLNVISTYALLETGWKTVLGNAEKSWLFLKKLKLPLKISERAWWLKVSLLSKHKSGVKGSGPAPMDLSTMNTGNTVNTDSTETKQTKRNTCCGCSSVAAFVPEDVVTEDLLLRELLLGSRQVVTQFCASWIVQILASPPLWEFKREHGPIHRICY